MFFLSPQSFMFFSVYNLIVILLFSLDNFFVFWCAIELSTLVFMGMSFSLFKNNFSSLLIFFIIQTVAAFSLLVFFNLSMQVAFSLSVLLKLAMFPFYFWYLRTVSMFPNFVFLFSRTFFKLPTFFMLNSFSFILSYSVLFPATVLTILFASVHMFARLDLRRLLIASSVANNSWFFLSQFVRITIFSLYYLFYFLFLFVVLVQIGSLLRSSVTSYNSSTLPVLFSLFSLAGLPPFPVFFVKMLIVYTFVAATDFSIFTFFLMLFTVLIMSRYLKHVFTMIMFNFNNALNYV